MPSSLQARNTRMAISPLLATRTFRIFLISNSPYVSIAFFQMKSAYIFLLYSAPMYISIENHRLQK